jgi:hypothetical protein
MAELKHVNGGELIKSSAWNAMVDEINGKVNKSGDIMKGALTVNSSINAGTSEVYFPKTDHVHTGAVGNLEGHAAIENDSAWHDGSLMILGRSFYENGGLKKRVIHLHDDVTVYGPLQVNRDLSVNGLLLAKNSIHAANSDLYFTKIDHNHNDVQFGNKEGFAAIENAKDYDALLILGRQVGPIENGHNRRVRLWDYLEVNGQLQVNGSINAGSSDMYFTETNHFHTGIGNTKGFAAIENAKSHDALMILGRTVEKDGGLRVVKLWDYLEVNGKLQVNGSINAGSSDMYFTDVNHLHTGNGNKMGFAAIENAQDYDALLILGRTSGRDGGQRRVRLWDYLEVNGPLDVTGDINFNERLGQRLNLWRQGYGIGVQNSTLYFRSDDRFYWYRGGVHNDDSGIDSGGGREIMSLQGDGRLLLPSGTGSIGKVSDRRLKKNIQTLEKALDKLTQLRGVTFQWNEPELRGGEGIQTGLIAQEVEMIFPDWIKQYGEHKTIAMPGFDALIIESFKELKAEINKIKTHLNI